MRQHVTYGAGGTLTYTVRNDRDEVRYPDTANSATYSIFKEDDAKYNATAKITGTCTYGWETDLASAHNATAGQMLKLTSTAGIKPGDLLLITHKTLGHSEQLRVTNLADNTSGRVRINRETVFDYLASAGVVNPVLKVSISSAQAQSASLLDIDQNHRMLIEYTVDSTELSENMYFDVVRRWPRPPVLPIDIYEARPELRYEVPDTYMVHTMIKRAWEDMLEHIRSFGKLPQYIQNEEALRRQLRDLSLFYLCRDVGQNQTDGAWASLADGYRESYSAEMDDGVELLRFDVNEELDTVSTNPNFSVVEFQRGGKGARRKV